MINVLIVEDERLVQEAFKKYIESRSDKYKLIDSIINADNAEIICLNQKIDLILMDVCTSNNSSGLEAAKKIKNKCPNIKIIIVTSAPEFRFIDKAKKANVDSFWYKDSSKEELLSIMDKTMDGEKIFPDKTPSIKIGNARSEEFTKTELEILLHLVTGISTSEIASKMNISINTAKWHIKNLMEKTNSSSRTQLAIYASKARLVLPEY